MPLFDDFQQEDIEMLASLPYRVGIYIARADDAKDTRRDERREERALIAVLEALASHARKRPFLATIVDQTLSHRSQWDQWRARKGLTDDIARALRLIGERLPVEVLAEFRQALYHIGCVVAQAYGEKADNHSEAMISELSARLSDRFFNPLEKNPENISPVEKAALQKLREALKR